jgi:hypothetical protein
MAEPFTIGIKLKPYVARHLINTFGDPVNLYCKEGRSLHQFIINALKNPEKRYDKRINLDYFDGETRFVISKSDFYQYGWEMSKTDMVKFNSIVEAQVKIMCRCYILFDKSLGVPVYKSAKNFQNEFGFSEQDFPAETIIKDFNRNASYLKFDKTLIIKDIKKLFTVQLSKIRTFA